MALVYDKMQLDSWAKAGFNLLPVSMEISADLLTPVAAFTKLKAALGGDGFLLESAAGGEHVGRFSFLGLQPFQQVRLRDHELTVTHATKGTTVTTHDEPHRALEKEIAKWTSPFVKHLPPLQGGMVGYVGYDAIRFWEPIPMPTEASGFDDAFLCFYDTVLAFDHLRHSLHFMAHVKPGEESMEQGLQRIEADFANLAKILNGPTPLKPLAHVARPKGDLLANARVMMGEDGFKGNMKRLKKHIRDGDIFQCVLSERFDVNVPKDPFQVYRVLRMINPSPYLYYLQQGDQTVLGASPEMLVKVHQGRIETCPIAGTRPRGDNAAADAKRQAELLASVKERAEHLMLVDLGRNDIGRLAVPGTVQVPDYMTIEKFSHVMHIVSRVTGKLPARTSAWRALEACFPAGTLTGAPKIRAMQIISDMEPARRGPYGGAIICQDFSNNLNSCIAIRSLFINGKRAYLQAGAGIVADSRADSEYEEIHSKAKGVAMALRMAEEVGGLIMGSVILIDNYDSFTYNVYQYLGILKVKVKVIRNDVCTVAEVMKQKPSHVVISPGPGHPKDAGITTGLIEACARGNVPLLGICLGHQAIGLTFGANIVHAPKALHGKVSAIAHNNSGVFKGLPSPIIATRYHSLLVAKEKLPANLLITAQTDDGLIMGLRHKKYAIEGVQFHPESFATEHGLKLLANFLKNAR